MSSTADHLACIKEGKAACGTCLGVRYVYNKVGLKIWWFVCGQVTDGVDGWQDRLQFNIVYLGSYNDGRC